MSTPLWITATPPAPCAELDIGHLAGPYVAADVLARFLRADGERVLFTTGTADHTASVAARALRAQRTPEDVADGYRTAIRADWQHAGIEFDHIVHPRRDRGYARWTRALFRSLHADGAIVVRSRPMPYCVPCERRLHGALVTGGCPHCAAASEGGVCRVCALPNDGGTLTDPSCTLCGTPAQLRRSRRPYFALEQFRGPLADYWAASELPPSLAVLCETLVEDGLPDVAVGHPGDWGIPVPVDGLDGHRIDGCFEAAAMHLFGQGFDKQPLPERTAHFGGFGHTFCHAVLLPAILLAKGVKLPQDFYVNETRTGAEGHEGAWALDLLIEYGSDTLRRHVLEGRTAARRPDFRLDEPAATLRILTGTWNGWLNRLFDAVYEENGGVIPDAAPGGAGWGTQLRRLHRAADDLRDAYSPESFDPRRVVLLLDEVVLSAADFGYANAHQRRRPSAGGRHLPSLTAQLSIASALCAWAAPVMPEGSRRLASALHIEPGRPVTADALAVPSPGTRLLRPSGPVFGF
ncbi:class I tRNA ligase family protein [Streptomyces sp. NBC_00963]|uniref:class I tRNA ligase family protein n=1 Tax=Streptomyces sp. NBC_00963 TaxID=2903697 RepID=UPI00386A000B|nr:class I tRNA ligase family protein [Streptomyces sp. NBC_00963]